MSKRILIVDDNNEDLTIVREALESTGFEIEESHSPTDALDYVMKNHFDLVVLDYMMPLLHGDEISRIVKELSEKRRKPTKIILYTGYSDVSPENMKKVGVDDVVLKTTDTGSLKRKILSYFPNHLEETASIFKDPLY